MKVLEQARLFFQQGTSDKVYEVDLVEIGPAECVVNFRYGRRGMTLKDGSKTPLPVDYRSAKAVFDELVASKVAKGYQQGSAPARSAAAPSAAVPPPPRETGDRRATAILRRLTEGKDSRSSWSLDRAIWRAADIPVPRAVPLLLNFRGASRTRDYAILAALGTCGGPDAVAALKVRFKGAATDLNDPLDRMTVLALLKAGDETVRGEVAEAIGQRLPVAYRDLIRNGAGADLQARVQADLRTSDAASCEMMDVLYVMDSPVARPIVLDFVRNAPLRPSTFQRIRHIFKAAEYRRDAEVFGVIAHRFETVRSMYTRPTHMWRDRFFVTLDGASVQVPKNEPARQDTRVAYSTQTRAYLRQRVWRTLRRLGHAEDPAYVRMAVGTLLPFRDADAAEPRETFKYKWVSRGNVQRVSTWWDAYARFHAFNAILYTHSNRYARKPKGKGWFCQPNYHPGDPAPAYREEAFPHLWDRQPQGLLHLINASLCGTVHEFAVRALRSNDGFTSQLDKDALVMMLASPYTVSAGFGFELVNQRFARQTLAVDTDILLALAGCAVPEARSLACTVTGRLATQFAANDTLIAGLLLCRHADVRAFAERFLVTAMVSDPTACAVFARVIAALTALDAKDAEYARAVGQALIHGLERKLHLISLEVVCDLLAHPLVGVQELGADILVKHNLPSARVPDPVLRALLNSEHEGIRALGTRILAQYSDVDLLSREDLLASLAMHRREDIRTAIRPIIKRLAEGQPAFGRRVAQQFLEILIRSRLGDDLLNDLARLLTSELNPYLDGVDSGTVWRLLSVKSTAAQDVGGSLLRTVDPKDLELHQIVRLADHDVASVRDGARSMLDRSVDRVKADMFGAVRLLDAKWDDTREFAFRFFRERLDRSDFTPDVLVALCDSVRDDVQQFGQQMLLAHFDSADALTYLTRLSEHPSVGMQRFVSSFVERWTADNPDRLRELEPFFRSCLMRVNRGRTAKQRIWRLLQTEAIRSESAARQIAALMTDLSATVSVEAKAACVEALVRIQQAYPQITTPLTIHKPEARHAV